MNVQEEYKYFIENCSNVAKSYKNYSDFSRICKTIASVKGVDSFDIYSITSVRELEDIKKVLENNEEYLEYNKTGGNQYSNALMMYLRFLKARSFFKSEDYCETKNCENMVLQQIFYGAPGTGKSYTIDNLTNDRNSIRTTFHPDSDYSTFVGCYKPTKKERFTDVLTPLSDLIIIAKTQNNVGDKVKFISQYAESIKAAAKIEDVTDNQIFCNKKYFDWNNETYLANFLNEILKVKSQIDDSEITYEFVPQAFTNAYVAAWNNVKEPFFLIIEEINRGNCAQIFGDIFQLLDRNEQGYSSYKTTTDQDLANYISKQFEDTVIDDAEVKSGRKMQLPPNLHIWATMNTSDQSLFPIDSAFKRRWNWKYVPIEYNPLDKRLQQPLNWKFKVGDKLYSWGEFLKKINPEIYSITESSDKQMGYFFAKAEPKTGVISEEVFLNKVLFYLWTDVFKDYDISSEIFKNQKANRSFRFTDFFEDPDALAIFINNCNLESLSDNLEDFDTDEQGGQSTFYNFISDGVKCRSITTAFLYILRNVCKKQNINFATIKAAVEQYIQRDQAVIKQIESVDTYEKENGWNSRVLTTSDNISFVVSNQWKKEFLPMIKAFAEYFGVNFEEK